MVVKSKPKSKAATAEADAAKSGGGSESSAGDAAKLSGLLLARVPKADLDDYSSEALDRAVAIALATLLGHKAGQSVVEIDTSGDIVHDGRPLSIITLVNDNMPFLFDSVMGEIAAEIGEPSLVLHPVIFVRHGPKGVSEIFGEGGSPKGAADADRVSLIQVHGPLLSPERAKHLKTRLKTILAQVRSAVTDWKPMLARLDETISAYRYNPTPLKQPLIDEAIAFLEWLRDDNFTFIGMRDYHYSGNEKTGKLERSEKRGLGILADPDILILRSGTEAVTTTPEVRAFLQGPEPLLVTKANAKSMVHRRAYLDYVGIKTFDVNGKLDGELRAVGLFTSTAYTKSVLKIPYLRSKAEAVIAKTGFSPSDHSGKALINVIESYPRDELFQIPVPILRKHAEAVLALGERPRVRALVRADQFDRFVSVLVFVPRDRYNSDVRERIGDHLKTVFDGRVSAYYPSFPEGSLARVHFIIGRSGGRTPKVESAELEAAIKAIVRTWDDALAEAAVKAEASPALVVIAGRFPESYQRNFSADEALVDARRIAELTSTEPIGIDFRRSMGQTEIQASLMIYHLGAPVSLSRRVPLLENIGFRVISERTFEVRDDTGDTVFVHDMELRNAFDKPIDLADGGALFDDVFLSVWRGASDNDGYNSLAQTAGLRNAEIVVLRALGRYLQQAGIPQNQDFIAAALNRYPAIARHLHALFVARFDPAAKEGREKAQDAIRASIGEALDGVPNLEDDMVLRRLWNLVESALRTNHFQKRTPEARSLAIKFDPKTLDGLPEPKPWREIFVYGAEVEGVHLRFGPVARGGLRWSDRAQDYRTEVLGLVKAQQVKNAVIVPVGAKGGFYPKMLPPGGARDAIFAAGTAAYVNFVSSLLSITDNLDGDRVVPPENVVRHDGDDPYFVVAADKGTATFSDTANGISQKHGFWLDDAFASGGSVGYDHKKMGITARGAWEAVKRHFRELNRDIQTEAFTVVGVGDMSGDVFGNGMLLSEKTRLIAAFDHRDIFIDPQPDEAASFAERQRMFALPRSSWQDYDKSKISEGGGVFSRSQKTITLSSEAAEAIGLSKTMASPPEIMTAILKAPVDLLWFGGIGTYVRASSQSNADVGDRANDAIRVTAREVGAKVIGEGANLGITQDGRIEYGLVGGRCNSDAIDNSGGVNSSDVEVNIKIALSAPMRDGSLKRPARDKFLAEMTDEVASLVLANNYRQTLAISLARKRGMVDLPHQARFMAALERRGLLNRAVESLPDEQALTERAARGEPLTRAEIGVLLAYAKIVLFDDIVASPLPDEAHLDQTLLDYFPVRMAKKYPGAIRGHRLRREIIATVVANDLINRGGPSFVTELQDQTGAGAGDIASAYTTVSEGYELPALYAEIDGLDTRLDGGVQLDLYLSVGRLIRAATAWYLKNDAASGDLATKIGRLRDIRKAIEPKLASIIPSFMQEKREERAHAVFKAGTPQKLAEKLAMLPIVELLPDIAHVASVAEAEPLRAAKAFFAVTEAFRIGRIEDAARAIVPSDYYDGLALGRATDMIDRARRGLAVAALSGHAGATDPVADWLVEGGERINRTRERLHLLTEGGELTVSRLTVAAGLMTDLSTV